MKTCLITLLAVGLVGSLAAGPEQPVQPTAKTQLPPPQFSADELTLKTEAPNEIQGRHITYTGVLPQVIKARQPLQLINPAAPPEYWPEHDNADRDSNGNITGFKFLSFKF
jgi:hypothetical protein